MGVGIRFTGLSSGLDTQSIVEALLQPQQSKIDKVKANQTIAQWKKDAYKEMSLKIQNFRNGALSKLKYSSNINKAKATVSQEGVINVDTNTYLKDGTHKIQVEELASQAAVKTTTIKSNDGTKLTSESNVSQIESLSSLVGQKLKIGTNEITITDTTTIQDLEDTFNGKDGISFTFDDSAQAFIINTTETGENQKIVLDGSDTDLLNALGIDTSEGKTFKGSDATIIYNGSVTMKSATNNIEINGIKFTAVTLSETPITVNIKKDIDASVDLVKQFIEEYNSLLSEMQSKLSADSAKGYSPLTDEKKEAMTDKEIEDWENKIKSALLRNDNTLKDINSTLRSIMTTDYSKTTDGLAEDCCMLSQLGISSSNWTDRGKLNISDEETLRKALSENGDDVTKLLNTIANKIDAELTKRSSSTEYRSYGQYFADKTITSNLSTYAEDLITAQERYDKLETMYYKKFTAMETAMNKLNSQSSLFSNL